jgi:glyoxylase-like metal-dependent hydrolase (beta-lactamase superfamily II)
MQIINKIHLLELPFEIHFPNGQIIPRFVNSIIIFGKEITLIDTGVKYSIQSIFDYIERQGRKISEIKRIILSHSHPDHLGSAAKIKDLTHCKVLAHKAEKEWIENIEVQLKSRPVPGFYELLDRSVKIDEYLEDGKELELDNDVHVRVIHSPGHSPGSINLQFLEDKVLFTADSIPLKNDIPNYDNYKLLVDSLEKIRGNQSYEILLSSWTSPIEDKNLAIALIDEGTEYLKTIDQAVKENYTNEETKPFLFCEKVIAQLGLPQFFRNPICDKAFRTHLL